MKFINTLAFTAALASTGRAAPTLETRAPSDAFSLRFTSPDLFAGQVVASYGLATRAIAFSNQTDVTQAQTWNINEDGFWVLNDSSTVRLFADAYPYSNVIAAPPSNSDTSNFLKCTKGAPNYDGTGQFSCYHVDKQGYIGDRFSECPGSVPVNGKNYYFLHLRNATTATLGGCVPVDLEYYPLA